MRLAARRGSAGCGSGSGSGARVLAQRVRSVLRRRPDVRGCRSLLTPNAGSLRGHPKTQVALRDGWPSAGPMPGYQSSRLRSDRATWAPSRTVFLALAPVRRQKSASSAHDRGVGFPPPMDPAGGGLRPWFEVTPEVHALVMSEAREARAAATRSRAWLPPRWFVLLFWHRHRALVRVTRGRLGLWRPKPDGWGALRLTTTGRRAPGGRDRSSSATSRTVLLALVSLCTTRTDPSCPVAGLGGGVGMSLQVQPPRGFGRPPPVHRHSDQVARQEPRHLRRAAASGNRRGRTRAAGHCRPAAEPVPAERATASPEGSAQ